MEAKYTVDIDEVISDFESHWLDSPNYSVNPIAFTKKKYDSNNINMCCPFHNESKPSFGISIEYPYYYNCFSCGEKGNLISLIMYVYDLNYWGAYQKIRAEYSTLGIDKLFEEEEDVWEDVTEEEIEVYLGKKHSYISSRGLSDYSLIKYEIGFDESSYSVTFPVRYLNGDPAFIIRRSVNSKFFNIPENAPKKEVLYGLNYLNGRVDEVYITEGAIDTVSCYEAKLPAIGLMGRSLTTQQIKVLQKAGIKRVILFLDNDKWGVIGTLASYKSLSKTPITVMVATYPKQWGVDAVEGLEYKDPNDLLCMGLMDQIKVVPFVNFYTKLLFSKYYKGVIKDVRKKDRF